MRRLSFTLIAAIAAIAMTACCCNNNKPQSTGEENKMIRLNVFVTVSAEYHDEVVEGLNQMAVESQKEDGCIGYDIFQNTLLGDQLIIVETWRDQAALDAHGQTTHYTTVLPPLKDKMQMKLERFDF